MPPLASNSQAIPGPHLAKPHAIRRGLTVVDRQPPGLPSIVLVEHRTCPFGQDVDAAVFAAVEPLVQVVFFDTKYLDRPVSERGEERVQQRSDLLKCPTGGFSRVLQILGGVRLVVRVDPCLGFDLHFVGALRRRRQTGLTRVDVLGVDEKRLVVCRNVCFEDVGGGLVAFEDTVEASRTGEQASGEVVAPR